MAVRKSLVIEIRKTQTNKTFLVSDFKFHQATRKCFRNLFEIKQAEIFPSCVLDIHRNFRNWHQLFYNRSGSYKIHALPVSSFLVYRFHGNIDYLENLIQPNFNSWSRLVASLMRGRAGPVTEISVFATEISVTGMRIFVICLLLQASYIRIILEVETFITYLPVELIFETFKDLSFSTR